MTHSPDPHVAWMAEHDVLYPAANEAGITDQQSMDLAGRLVDAENALIGTAAATVSGCFLRCLAVVKISADGLSIGDNDARAIEAEADAFRAEQRSLQDAFDLAYQEYKRVRAISDALDGDGEEEADGRWTCDRLVDDYCQAMDRLIEDVRAPTVDALLIKINLADARAEGAGGWFADHRRGIMEDLDFLATRMLPA